MIHLTKPSINNYAIQNVLKVLKSKKFADGEFQSKAEALISKKIKSKFVALTQSCTDALEMSSLVLGLNVNDEVIFAHLGRGTPKFLNSYFKNGKVSFSGWEKIHRQYLEN